ncbi:MAG: PQQ-binding-like beta-propeller repeat protein [Burkholderiales bacterium]|nr:PQQ-binding-like beta-propeller repeat protein [Burkholderiales bacterium]
MKKTTLSLFLSVCGLLASFNADATDIAPVPLTSLSVSGSVKANIMVLLDNSGSMDWDYVGDFANDQYCKTNTGAFNGYCCTSNSASSSGSGSSSCYVGSAPFTSTSRRGHPPFLNTDFNGVAYNPAVVYQPTKNADGSSRLSMTSGNTGGWTAVPNDAYGKSSATGNINFLTQFPDMQWCSDTGLTNCVRNDNYLLPGTVGGTNYQYLKVTVATGSGNKATGSPASPSLVAGTFGPHYYGIRPGEYCTTSKQTSCATQAAPSGSNPFPATVRWCSDPLLATCQVTKTDTFQYPRYPGRVITSVATVKVIGSGSRSVSNITVNGQRIMSGSTSSSTSSNTVASRIATNINNCKAVITGSCQVAGYSATVSGSTVTISAPLSNPSITYAPVVSPSTFTTVVAFNGSGGAVPGSFVRVDIVPGINSYADPASTTNQKHPNRTDCAGSTCTYAEEMTNFANWWTYYRTRMQTMKTSLSLAFNSVGGNYQVGLALLSDVGYGGTVTTSSHGMFPAVFSGSNRTDWYTKLFATDTASSTALRVALDQMGKMYANQSPYNFTGSNRVVQYACQQNFTLVTTDGYWNETYGGSVSNNDTTENVTRFCTRTIGCVDPSSSSQVATLADAALYWYNGGSNTSTVSIRPDLEPDISTPGKLPVSTSDPNTHLHMTTYTMGLGVSGNVTYEKNYDTSPDPAGDFIRIIQGSANWPQAVSGAASTVDDLWHAAVNGHGKYFSARTPNEVVDGLNEALANMQIRSGAASAAATSTPNISQYDNDIFSSTYTTVKWFGEVTAQKIDPTTGNIQSTITWSSSSTVGQKVASNSDTRKIYVFNGAGLVPKDFLYASLSAQEKAWFDNKGSTMAQYSALSSTNKAIVDSGANLVNWLRGQFQYADDTLFRAYTLKGAYTTPQDLTFNQSTNPYIVLGDVVNAKPAYVRQSFRQYPDASYATFKNSTGTRQAMVYIAANDGMLHAFNAATGEEVWAYAPRITMSKLYRQASTDYGANHQYTVDGSPETADVQIGGSWKTILVGGLNAGGRGYYALDITDPAAPKGLWEFCSDSSICSQSDADLGLTYGNPQIGQWNGQWVVMVTSGYNNTPGTDYAGSGGTGQGYLYILSADTGAILAKVSTGEGTTSTPSGLARIAAYTDNPQKDPVIKYVYGGDVYGNMWRFDLSLPPAVSVVKMAALGSSQPITAKPDITYCKANATEFKRVVVWGTGRLLGSSDTADFTTQSLYAVKDLADGAAVGYGGLSGSGSMVRQTLSINAIDTAKYDATNNGVNWSTQTGWYVDFNLRPGERVNIDPKILFGRANVITNLPSSADACSIGGSSYGYAFRVCGVPNDEPAETVGNLLSNTSPAVGFITYGLPNGDTVRQTTLANGDKTKDKPPVEGDPVKKSGWRSIKNY